MSLFRAARIAAVAALLLVGCGAPAAATPTPSPGAPPAPSGFTALKNGSLEPGKYAAANFEVPFTFTIPQGGTDRWSVFDTDRHSYVMLAPGEGVSTTVMAPSKAFKADGSEEAVPADWLGWLKAQSGLKVTAEGSSQVGGAAAPWVDVQALTAPDNDVCGAGGVDGTRIASTDELRQPFVGAVCVGDPKRVYAVTHNGRQLLVFVDGGIVAAAEPILTSINFY